MKMPFVIRCGDRKVVIEGFAEIFSRRIAFDGVRWRIRSCLEAPAPERPVSPVGPTTSFSVLAHDKPALKLRHELVPSRARGKACVPVYNRAPGSNSVGHLVREPAERIEQAEKTAGTQVPSRLRATTP
jgi:hypothetical protein